MAHSGRRLGGAGRSVQHADRRRALFARGDHGRHARADSRLGRAQLDDIVDGASPRARRRAALSRRRRTTWSVRPSFWCTSCSASSEDWGPLAFVKLLLRLRKAFARLPRSTAVVSTRGGRTHASAFSASSCRPFSASATIRSDRVLSGDLLLARCRIARGAQDRRDRRVLCVRKRRRNLRAEHVHRVNDGRHGWAHRAPSISRRDGRHRAHTRSLEWERRSPESSGHRSRPSS